MQPVGTRRFSDPCSLRKWMLKSLTTLSVFLRKASAHISFRILTIRQLPLHPVPFYANAMGCGAVPESTSPKLIHPYNLIYWPESRSNDFGNMSILLSIRRLELETGRVLIGNKGIQDQHPICYSSCFY
jgi:hypothetical protein